MDKFLLLPLKKFLRCLLKCDDLLSGEWHDVLGLRTGLLLRQRAW
jgi:hypothetical protein